MTILFCFVSKHSSLSAIKKNHITNLCGKETGQEKMTVLWKNSHSLKKWTQKFSVTDSDLRINNLLLAELNHVC